MLVLEKTSWASITPSVAPYISNTLVPMGAHAEQYFSPPVNPVNGSNYVWLEAGDTLGLTMADPSASNSTSTVDHLATYLETAGISWKAYEGNISGTSCPLQSGEGYAASHNPFVFFQDVTSNNDSNSSRCIAHNRPFSELATDLQNNAVARYNFIAPNLCDGLPDCSVTTGDTWLSNNLPAILSSQAYQDHGAVFITWDGGANHSDGPVGMIVLSPLAKVNYSNSIHYTHSSTLRTMQTIFSVGPPTNAFLRDAANATDLSDLFTTANPVPALSSLAPSSATAGGAASTLRVSGSSFAASSVVQWNGTARATTFMSSTQLQAAIDASDIAAAGTAQVTVVTPAPGGGTSAALTFTVDPPAPTLSSLAPSSASAGGAAFILTVGGSSFAASSVVQWNGTARATTFVSSTQLQAAIDASDIAAAGTAKVTVVTPAPGGGTSAALTFIVDPPAPTLSALAPSSAAAAGAAFTLTVSGSSFAASSVVQWNGTARATTFVSSTQLQAAIDASDIAAAGAAQVTVVTPAPGGGTSVALTFTVDPPMATLSVTSSGSGSGTVTSSPTGIACSTACTGSFTSGALVTLTATPSETSAFMGWSRGGCSGTGPCTLTLTSDTSVTAVFDLRTASSFTLTVAIGGSAGGTVTSSPPGINCGSSCSTAYVSGTSGVLTATPVSGAAFRTWRGACTSDAPICTVAMSTAQSVTAVFSQVFTDGTGQGSDIPAESVVIKAVHITELRSAIDTLRAVDHLAPVGWTDATLSPGSTLVESFYISDLRAALTATYRALNIAAPAFTDPDIIPGVTVIKAAHLNELREAVRNLE